MMLAMGQRTVAVAGSTTRFYDLYQREAGVVLRYLRSVVRDQAAAEDLCADAFCRAWDAWPRFKGTDVEARAWLLRIARNLVIDRVRRDGRVKFTVLSEETPAPSAYPHAELIDLRNAMAKLDRDDRDLLAMRIAGLSHAEIALVINKSEGAVKKAWLRALARLRNELEVRP
jgi:RNA polymerase sigma-70 factor (ECF subfamily)